MPPMPAPTPPGPPRQACPRPAPAARARPPRPPAAVRQRAGPATLAAGGRDRHLDPAGHGGDLVLRVPVAGAGPAIDLLRSAAVGAGRAADWPGPRRRGI